MTDEKSGPESPAPDGEAANSRPAPSERPAKRRARTTSPGSKVKVAAEPASSSKRKTTKRPAKKKGTAKARGTKQRTAPPRGTARGDSKAGPAPAAASPEGAAPPVDAVPSHRPAERVKVLTKPAAESQAGKSEPETSEWVAPRRPEPVSRQEILLEFEQRPLLEPPYPVHVPQPAMPGKPRRIAFVLHAHLPWVLGHGTWPHGEDWLAEAIAHCYLPLFDAFRRLADRGRRNFVTVSVTPVLAAAFADPRTAPLVERYLSERTKAAWESRQRHPLALWWHAEYERLRAIWDSFHHDLVRALAELGERGAVELSTSAGAHLYLPLAHSTKLIRLALRTGCENHRELFGVDPRGCWMPECAYRPGGPWQHPVTGASEESRAGNEEFLEEQGLQWTVVDGHLLRDGDPAFPYLSDLPPEEVAEPGGPHPKPYWIRRSAVAAFLRDARSAAQVWSRQGGYPGDGAFLDFHKRHWPSGLRLWRVTGEQTDMLDKLVYWPDDARAKAEEQAAHFLRLVAGLDGMDGGVVCAPFDAELFGHWWFEGPIWLEKVLDLAGAGSQVEATTPSRELDAGPSLRRAFFAEGSWGAGGDHSVWVNSQTEWFWRELADLERRAFSAVRWRGSRKWRRAILNQLLLAAASDWPFLVTMGTGGDYAEMRFREHAARLRELIDLGPRTRWLPDWVDADLPFPDLEPEWALAPLD